MRRSADVAPFQRVRGAPEEPLIAPPPQPVEKGRSEAPELSAVLLLRPETPLAFADE